MGMRVSAAARSLAGESPSPAFFPWCSSRWGRLRLDSFGHWSGISVAAGPVGCVALAPAATLWPPMLVPGPPGLGGSRPPSCHESSHKDQYSSGKILTNSNETIARYKITHLTSLYKNTTEELCKDSLNYKKIHIIISCFSTLTEDCHTTEAHLMFVAVNNSQTFWYRFVCTAILL